jgi:hypothetical protein
VRNRGGAFGKILTNTPGNGYHAKKKFGWYTTILNHSREWGGKPTGLTETAGLPKYPTIFGNPAFLFSDVLILMGLQKLTS